MCGAGTRVRVLAGAAAGALAPNRLPSRGVQRGDTMSLVHGIRLGAVGIALLVVAAFGAGGGAAMPDAAGATAELPRNSGFVILDTTVTPELAAEGLARDVIRAVQQARRDAGLSVSDRIKLGIDGKDDVVTAVKTHEALLASETLALSVSYGHNGGTACKVGDGAEVVVKVERVPMV